MRILPFAYPFILQNSPRLPCFSILTGYTRRIINHPTEK